MAYFVWRDADGKLHYGMDAKSKEYVDNGGHAPYRYLGDGTTPVYTEEDYLDPTAVNSRNAYFNTLISEVDKVVDNEWWKNLGTSEKRAFIESNYRTDEFIDWSNLWGLDVGKDYSIDVESLLEHLEELSNIDTTLDFSMPTLSEDIASDKIYAYVDKQLADDKAKAYARLNSAIAGLDAEAVKTRQSYEDQLRTNADMYDRQASGLLSNQYLANAQTYDALQSDLRKSRQNALEAGASAGIRLAGNVNALLTAQNKQSQTAMDTSNALAEMLLQQRNAAAGVRSDYRSSMSDINSRKTGYDLERTNLDNQFRNTRETMYNNRYNALMSDYNADMAEYNNNVTNWENQFDGLSTDNPFTNPYMTHLRAKNNINY